MFNKLTVFSKQHTDKLIHYIVSQILFLVLYIGVLYLFDFSQVLSVLYAAGIAFIIGVLKEIYDYISGTGNPELLDIIANSIGIFILAISILL